MCGKFEGLDDDVLMDVARKWYLTLEENGADEQILSRFNDWAGEAPSHRRAFEAVIDFWSRIEMMPEIEKMRAAGPDNGESFFPVPKGTNHPGGSEVVNIIPGKPAEYSAGRWPLWRNLSGAAAVFIICALMVSFYITYLPQGTYRTQTGAQQVVHLPDGTVVYLNTNTKIHMDYSDDIRRVVLLEGEARFEVAADKNRPFIVVTSRGEVRAVGTSFNIYDSEDAVEIIVFEGTVAVNRPRDKRRENRGENDISGKAVLVTGGKRIVAFDNRLSVVRAADELEIIQKNAWREGKLVFRGQKLSQVIAEMARYTHRKIIIADDALKDMKLGGAFDIEDVDALLHAIEDAFPVRIIRFTPYIAVITEAWH